MAGDAASTAFENNERPVWGPWRPRVADKRVSRTVIGCGLPQSCRKRVSDGVGAHKVDTNGGDVALRVGVVGETEEQAGLAHTRVPDQLRGAERGRKLITRLSRPPTSEMGADPAEAGKARQNLQT